MVQRGSWVSSKQAGMRLAKLQSRSACSAAMKAHATYTDVAPGSHQASNAATVLVHNLVYAAWLCVGSTTCAAERQANALCMRLSDVSP
ncbi:hypothetical protein HaLaN_26374 [Haematococcus lacustris]|uniref:Uncharacterized protein n=1 Tax=Haematococcus lacustris TaxID=44745 RepID=A0A6A0A652_HAELA|nr:hypothetical protein HaLaN_26374 [Haematococcus lacustris]